MRIYAETRMKLMGGESESHHLIPFCFFASSIIGFVFNWPKDELNPNWDAQLNFKNKK